MELEKKGMGIVSAIMGSIEKKAGFFSLQSTRGITRAELYVLLEKQPFAVIITDIKGIIRFANINALSLTGYSNLINKPFVSLLLKDKDNPQSNITNEKSYSIIEQKNKQLVPVFMSKSQIVFRKQIYMVYNLLEMDYINKGIKSELNQYYKNYEIFKNQHGQYKISSFTKAIEQSLENATSEEDMAKEKILFDELWESVFLIDSKGNILESNSRAYKSLGYTKQEMKKMNFRDILIDEHKALFEKKILELSKKNEINIIVTQKGKGEIKIPVELRAYQKFIFKQEFIICIVKTRIDYVQKDKPELDLNFSTSDQNILMSAFNLAPSTMFILNKELEVIKANYAAIVKYKIIEKSKTKQSLGQLINCSDKREGGGFCGIGKKCVNCSLYTTIRQVIDKRSTIIREKIILDSFKDGEHQVDTILISIADLGANAGMLVTFDNITDREKAEKELIHAKELAEESENLKTIFINNLSHEIRTPLNGIMGFSEILINSTSPEDINRFAQIINKSGKRLLNVIEDLFTVSSILSKSIKPRKDTIHLGSLIEDLKLLLYEELNESEKHYNIALKFNFPKDLEENTINTDYTLLMVIVRNIVRNAFKFTDHGIVEVGLLDINRNEKTFYIKDSGIGIEKDKQDIIFEFFRQGSENYDRKYEGIGTGLSIAKHLVELTGGKLWFESSKNKGTTFYFTLSEDLLEISPIKHKVVDNSILNGKDILVVEDNDFNFELYKLLLQEHGANPIRAASGEDAIDLILSGIKVSLVLMDIRLPGIDGYETTKTIKNIVPELKIIAQSALTNSDEIDRAFKCGCIDFIEKPTTNSTLIEKIARHIT